MRLGAILLSLALLCACDDLAPAEQMSLRDARANLLKVAGSGSPTAFCTEEGRRNFRQAVRTFTAAVEAEHAEIDLTGGGEALDPAWGLVSIGVVARIVQSSDLAGPTRSIAMAMNMPGATPGGISGTRDAMATACPELIVLYRETALLGQMQSRAHQYQDDSPEARRRFHERMVRQHQNVARAGERLERKMRMAGWDGPSLTDGGRP